MGTRRGIRITRRLYGLDGDRSGRISRRVSGRMATLRGPSTKSRTSRPGGGNGMPARRDEALDCLAGGGDMGRLMRAHDWSVTPLGPTADWPQSLKTAVRIILGSRYPM